MDIEKVLSGLYASEIPGGIAWVPDGGFDWWVGSIEFENASARGGEETVEEAAQAMHAAALSEYPDSEYARKDAYRLFYSPARMHIRTLLTALAAKERECEVLTAMTARAEQAEARVKVLEEKASGLDEALTLGLQERDEAYDACDILKSAWTSDVAKLTKVKQERDAYKARCEALESALERTLRNFLLAIKGKPVRDMTETLAECETALRAVEG